MNLEQLKELMNTIKVSMNIELNTQFNQHDLRLAAVGSRRTCNPPPTDTDDDYLIFVSDHYQYRQELLTNVFMLGGSLFLDVSAPLDKTNRFSYYCKGDVNLIVTQNLIFLKSSCWLLN